MKYIFTICLTVSAIPQMAQKVTDFDGNEYATVTIGEQIWMAENIKSLHYADGSEVAGWYTYQGDTSNISIYGRLYTWHAAMKGANASNEIPSGVQGICPAGWHLPSSAEWNSLFDFLGGTDLAGGKMKSTGTYEAATGLWKSPNEGATDESGFKGLPGGYRYYAFDSYPPLGSEANFWSTSHLDEFDEAQAAHLFHDFSFTNLYPQKDTYGFSVRCVKNSGTAGIDTRKDMPFRIFPNPVNDRITILKPNASAMVLTLYCGAGRPLIQQKLFGKNPVIDVSSLTSGVYFIIISGNQGIFREKMVKL